MRRRGGGYLAPRRNNIGREAYHAVGIGYLYGAM